MSWTPKGWWTPTSTTPAHLRLDACPCPQCAIDGQHNLLCEVHEDPPKACDCARGEAPKSAPAAEAA